MAIFNQKSKAFINRVYWSSRHTLSFERLWSLPKNWFDTPNEARSDWSGVTRTELDTQKSKTKVFFKSQQNYTSRTWRNPFRSISTFQKELNNFTSLDKLDPTHLNQQQRQQILRKLAKFTPKSTWKIRLIDLEKMHWRFSSKLAVKRDLSRFNRHAGNRWTLKDRVYFLKKYFNAVKLTPPQKSYSLNMTVKLSPNEFEKLSSIFINN